MKQTFIMASEYVENEASFENQKDKTTLTVPDMSYKIKDLLLNHTKRPEIQRPVLWEEEPDMDNFVAKFGDLTDIDEYKNELANLQSSMQNKQVDKPAE